jgi:hypothetical protein
VRRALVAVALLGVSGTALAQAPAAAHKEAEPRVKVAAFALDHPGVTEAAMVEVVRAAENGLRKNQRLELTDLDRRLADFAQEVPQQEIDSARAASDSGTQALLELRIPEAVAKLEEAVAGLSKVLPYIKKQELADAMATLAVAQYEGGDKKAGRAQFVELLTWRADYAFDPQKLPPKYMPAFEEAQQEIARAKRGTVRITSVPDGAQAYVDGKYVGVTPCTSEMLPAGKHFITLKKEGYRKAVAPVTILGRREVPAEVSIERSQKYLLVEQALAKVNATLDQDKIDPDADNLRQVLFIDHAVFLRVRSGGEVIEVDAWLYDLRTRRKLSHTHSIAPAAGPEARLEPLAQNLYAGVSYSGELQAPVDAPPPQNVRPPIYKTWWFWTAAAVVVTGAVVTGVAISETRPPSCPDGDACIHFAP